MEKALIVIDMQEDYVGENRNKNMYSYETKTLLKSINTKIGQYIPENVIYIKTIKKNTFFNKLVIRYALEGTSGCELVEGLNIVSDNIFTKTKANAFTNLDFFYFLKEKNIEELEFVGVDGGVSVPLSAQSGVEVGFKVEIYKKAVGTVFKKRAELMESASTVSGVRYK